MRTKRNNFSAHGLKILKLLRIFNMPRRALWPRRPCAANYINWPFFLSNHKSILLRAGLLGLLARRSSPVFSGQSVLLFARTMATGAKIQGQLKPLEFYCILEKLCVTVNSTATACSVCIASLVVGVWRALVCGHKQSRKVITFMLYQLKASRYMYLFVNFCLHCLPQEVLLWRLREMKWQGRYMDLGQLDSACFWPFVVNW